MVSNYNALFLYHLLFFYFFVSLVPLLPTASAAVVEKNNSNKNTIISPIPNFQESWTASSIQGTTIALPCTLLDDDDDAQKQEVERSHPAVIVILRYPAAPAASGAGGGNHGHSETEDQHLDDDDDGNVSGNNNQNPNAATTTRTRMIGGLRVLVSGTSSSSSSSRRRWKILPPPPLGSSSSCSNSFFCAMTGFAPDIEYLNGYMQNYVDEHRTIYEGTTASASTRMTILELVLDLADVFYSAEFRYGRPFGVQALLVGPSNSNNKENRLSVFALDPSGGYRHWGGGTAIGKSAREVRNHLAKDTMMAIKASSDDDDNGGSQKKKKIKRTPPTAGVALANGLRAFLRALVPDYDTSSVAGDSDDKAHYEALLIWMDQGGGGGASRNRNNNAAGFLCVTEVDPLQVQQIHQQVRNGLLADAAPSSKK